ncbi:hypothetical protein LTR37_002932 [Vermiconidia calcicola]|uniref:Uncharacterized protein n=1 Tax=Vermiconidia calcicola TaxID=1690605 RepID=A0ACC3NRR8_9PEZI|nr:hypothetical protein LTR37_002932 [Vermiconidia calcicola]
MATDSDQAAETSIEMLKFTVCGFPKPVYEKQFIIGTPMRQFERELLGQMGADVPNFRAYFHFEDELCFVQRPIRDLLALEERKDSILKRKLPCLHILRARWPDRPQLNVETAPATVQAQNDASSTGREDDGDDINSSRNNSTNLNAENESVKAVGGAGAGANSQIAAAPAANGLNVNVKFHFEASSPELSLDQTIWADQTLSFAPQTSFQDMFTHLLDKSRNVLSGDPNLCQEGQQCILFRPIITLDNKQARCLGDFYTDLSSNNLSMPVTARLTLDGGKSKSATATEILFKDWLDSYDYYYVGESLAGDSVDEGYGFDVKDTLVSWFADVKKLAVYQLPTWSVNGQRMGDCDSGVPVPRIKVRLDDRYGEILPTKEAIKSFLNDVNNKSARDALALTTPEPPVYCFNDSVVEMRNKGLTERLPKDKHIFARVRFVDFRSNEMDNEQPQWLPIPRHGMLEATEDHDVSDIEVLLNDQLRDEVGLSSAKVKELFESELENWKYMLWVLPQGSNTKKMFRYLEGNLTRFLDTQIVKEGKKIWLFMEAHLVPV